MGGIRCLSRGLAFTHMSQGRLPGGDSLWWAYEGRARLWVHGFEEHPGRCPQSRRQSPGSTHGGTAEMFEGPWMPRYGFWTLFRVWTICEQVSDEVRPCLRGIILWAQLRASTMGTQASWRHELERWPWDLVGGDAQVQGQHPKMVGRTHGSRGRSKDSMNWGCRNLRDANENPAEGVGREGDGSGSSEDWSEASVSSWKHRSWSAELCVIWDSSTEEPYLGS